MSDIFFEDRHIITPLEKYSFWSIKKEEKRIKRTNI